MTNKQFYQETFSQVHSSTELQWEEFAMKQKTRKSLRKLTVAAAVAAALTVVSVTAVAADLFGLRQLLLPGSAESISLAGYQASPESQALAEWRAYLDSDGEQQDTGALEGSGRFSIYQVYTPDMEEKLQEIAEEHDLTLHTQVVREFEYPEAFECLEDFLGEHHRSYNPVMYEDGTFLFDGECDLEDGVTLPYQMIRCVRGSFTDGLLSVGNVEDYQEQSYETACGQTVTLALGPEQALILADLEDCLVTVRIPGGVTEEQLRELADGLDFTVLSPVTAPDLSGEPDSDEDPLSLTAGLTGREAMDFARELLTLLEQNDRETVAELMAYPCQVTTEEGTFPVSDSREFLACYDQAVAPLTDTLREALMSGGIISHSGMVGLGGGAVWFAPTGDGEIRVFTLQSEDGLGVRPASVGITAGEP